MITIEKPTRNDLNGIELIMTQWTEPEEVQKYQTKILDEIDGKIKYNQQFWIAKKTNQIIGVTGLADPLPKSIHLAQTPSPIELKILYLDNQYRGKGIGKMLAEFIEKQAREQNRTELMVRSGDRYCNTAWGFYEKIGFQVVGEIPGSDISKIMRVFSKKL